MKAFLYRVSIPHFFWYCNVFWKNFYCGSSRRIAFVLCVVSFRRRQKQRGCFWNCGARPSWRIAFGLCVVLLRRHQKRLWPFWREEPHPPPRESAKQTDVGISVSCWSPFPTMRGRSDRFAIEERLSAFSCRCLCLRTIETSFPRANGSAYLPRTRGRGTVGGRNQAKKGELYSFPQTVDEVPINKKRERGEIPTKFSVCFVKFLLPQK